LGRKKGQKRRALPPLGGVRKSFVVTGAEQTGIEVKNKRYGNQGKGGLAVRAKCRAQRLQGLSPEGHNCSQRWGGGVWKKKKAVCAMKGGDSFLEQRKANRGFSLHLKTSTGKNAKRREGLPGVVGYPKAKKVGLVLGTEEPNAVTFFTGTFNGLTRVTNRKKKKKGGDFRPQSTDLKSSAITDDTGRKRNPFSQGPSPSAAEQGNVFSKTLIFLLLQKENKKTCKKRTAGERGGRKRKKKKKKNQPSGLGPPSRNEPADECMEFGLTKAECNTL